MGKKEAKQRYFDKVYTNAPMIKCACGCGTLIKSKDKYARDVKFVNGHNNRKYKDPTQYKREWNHRNREQRRTYASNRARKLKREWVKYKGGVCKCGYEYDGTNASAFDFHHLDPDTKEFTINTRTLNNYGKDRIRVEVDKCDLLCAICHRLKHNHGY